MAQWTFGHEEGGTVVTLGSDPSCDWHVTAAGVGALELTLFFLDGELLVKSERPGLGARVDGERLGGDWVLAQDGSRIDCGTACIEVAFTTVSDAQRTGADGHAEPQSDELVATMDERNVLESGVRRRPTEARPPQAVLVARDVPALKPALDDLDGEVSLPTIMVSPEAFPGASEASAEPERTSAPEFHQEPKPQPRGETRPSAYDVSVAVLPQEDRDLRLLRHALLGIALGFAYVCWVMFSDL